jgi:hypothetical protein
VLVCQPTPFGGASRAPQHAGIRFARIRKRGELLRAFRTTVRSARAGKRRIVAELRAGADVQRAQREKAEAARSKKAKAAAEAARQRHLAKLARDVDGSARWISERHAGPRSSVFWSLGSGQSRAYRVCP